jgi:hypothetical protein
MHSEMLKAEVNGGVIRPDGGRSSAQGLRAATRRRLPTCDISLIGLNSADIEQRTR